MSAIDDFSDLIPIISIILEEYRTINASSSSTGGIDQENAVAENGSANKDDIKVTEGTVSRLSEVEFVVERLLSINEWYEDAENVPVLKLIRQSVLDQTFDLTAILQSIERFASKPLQKSELDKCLKRKFKAASTNKLFNFDFNSMPDFEPLEFTLRPLRVDPGNLASLKKICNMDVGELVEHPQWEELLCLIGASLLSSNEAAAIESLRIHSKLLLSFSGIQYMHVCLNLLNHFHHIWCKDLSFGRFNNHQPSVIQQVLQLDLLKQLIATLLLVIHTLPDNIISASEKFVDTAIATLFLVLAHGFIEVECDGDDESNSSDSGQPIKINIIDIVLPQLLKSSSIKKLFNSWPLIAMISHAIHSSFIHVLLLKVKFSFEFAFAPSITSSSNSTSGSSISDSNNSVGFDDPQLHYENSWKSNYYCSVMTLLLSIIEGAASNTALLKVVLISLSDLMKPIDRTVDDAEELLCFHPYDMYWDGKMETKRASFGSLFVLMQPIEELNRRHFQLSGARLSPFELLNQTKGFDNSTFTGAMFLRFCSSVEDSPEEFLEVLAENVISKMDSFSIDQFPYLRKLLESLLNVLFKRLPSLHDATFGKIWSGLIKICRESSRDVLFDTLQFTMDHMVKIYQSTETSAIEICLQRLLDISDIIFSNQYFLDPFYSFASFEPRLLHILNLYFRCWQKLIFRPSVHHSDWIYKCEVWNKLTQMNAAPINGDVDLAGNVVILKEVFDFSVAICRNVETRLAKLCKSLGRKNVSVELCLDDSESASDDDEVEENGQAGASSRPQDCDDAIDSSTIDGAKDSPDSDVKSQEIEFVQDLKMFSSGVLEFICQYCKDFSNCSSILRKDQSVYYETVRILARVIALNVTEESSSDINQVYSLYCQNIDHSCLEQSFSMLLNCLSILNIGTTFPRELHDVIVADFAIVINYLESNADSFFDSFISMESDEPSKSIRCFANACRSFILSGYKDVMVDLWASHWSPLDDLAASNALRIGNLSFYLENSKNDLVNESIYPLFEYIFSVSLANMSRVQANNAVLFADDDDGDDDDAEDSLFIDERSLHIKECLKLCAGSHHIACGFLSSLSPASCDTEVIKSLSILDNSTADIISAAARASFKSSIGSILGGFNSWNSELKALVESKFDLIAANQQGMLTALKSNQSYYGCLVRDLMTKGYLPHCDCNSVPSEKVLAFVTGVEVLCGLLSVESEAFGENVYSILMLYALSVCDSKAEIVDLIAYIMHYNITLEVLRLDQRGVRLYLVDEMLQYDNARFYLSWREAVLINLLAVHPISAFINIDMTLNLVIQLISYGPEALIAMIARVLDTLKESKLELRNDMVTNSNVFHILRKIFSNFN